MSTKTLISLFGYKAWADSELFALLAKLPEKHAEQLHRKDVESTDAWYQDYVWATSDADLSGILNFSFTDGDTGRMSREEILMHELTHGGYHRGNVGQVLRSISIAPPRDLYTRFLHQSEPARRSA